MARKGSQKLAVLLCKFNDSPNIEPQPLSHYRDLFVNRGTGGLNDYWADASLGSIDLNGTEVFDWKIIPETRADFLTKYPGRDQKVQRAVDAFSVNRANYAGIVAIYNVWPGDGGEHGGVLGGPADANVTFLGHETGHVFGLDHSFDQTSRKLETWSAPGEYYDQYDIMSAMNVSNFTHSRFAQSGPRLCTPNLDHMGWLPAERVWTPGRNNSSYHAEFDLVSLSHPEIPGYLAATVGGKYVEFRTTDRWDAGIGRASVLIHTLGGTNAVVMASDRANFVNDWQPGQTFGPSGGVMAIGGGTRIGVVSFDLQAKKARIRVDVQARRPYEESVTVLGDIAIGDGWILLKDVLYRVPPKGGPLRELLEPIAELPVLESVDRATLELASALTAVKTTAERVVKEVGKVLFG